MVRLAWWALFSVFFIGCGPPFAARSTCAFGVNGPYVVVHIQGERDCSYYGEALSDAIGTIEANGFAARGGFADLHLWIWDTPESIQCDGQSSWGCYHPGTNVIELNRSAASLLHEMLHHIDKTGHDEDGHRQWDIRGAALGAPAVQISPQAYALKGSWLHVANMYEWRWYQRDKKEP